MRSIRTFSAALGAVLLAAGTAWTHCEVPCGIFGDELRIQRLAEDVQTVEKSMQEIVRLSGEGDKNYNQIVRWVVTKEEHARKIQEVLCQYFLFQRVKPADPKDAAAYARYVRQLTLIHRMTVEAMKTKQTTDLKHVKQFRALLEEFSDAYFDQAAREHMKEHHGAGAAH